MINLRQAQAHTFRARCGARAALAMGKQVMLRVVRLLLHVLYGAENARLLLQTKVRKIDNTLADWSGANNSYIIHSKSPLENACPNSIVHMSPDRHDTSPPRSRRVLIEKKTPQRAMHRY